DLSLSPTRISPRIYTRPSKRTRNGSGLVESSSSIQTQPSHPSSPPLRRHATQPNQTKPKAKRASEREEARPKGAGRVPHKRRGGAALTLRNSEAPRNSQPV
uniref:Uncharacterized protein n=1 Tax=Aegilops tauschii subsp. strangulata TaxID=200361 RepID=A0A453PWT6_AEGTS